MFVLQKKQELLVIVQQNVICNWKIFEDMVFHDFICANKLVL
jgi:hypothetical protein